MLEIKVEELKSTQYIDRTYGAVQSATTTAQIVAAPNRRATIDGYYATTGVPYGADATVTVTGLTLLGKRVYQLGNGIGFHFDFRGVTTADTATVTLTYKYAQGDYSIREAITATDKTADMLEPLKISQRLDQELDGGSIDFIKVDNDYNDKIGNPLSQYKITISDTLITTVDDMTVDFIGKDERSLITNKWLVGALTTAKPLNRHGLVFTEPSKLLQGVLIDGLRVVQPTDESITLKQVVERLLATTPLRRADETSQPFILTSDTAVVSLLQNTTAPQMPFNAQSNLWECLLQIGDVIGAIPRLTTDANGVLNTITFDILNKNENEITDLIDDCAYSYGENINAEQYNSGLSSIVENLTEE